MERLELAAGGRLLYRFKRAWRDGTSYAIFEPQELLSKLAALVPSPRTHLVRYSGLLGPAAKWRALIIPKAPDEACCPASHSGPPSPFSGSGSDSGGGSNRPAAERPAEQTADPSPIPQHPRNYSWSELMKRVFAEDVLECSRCGGRMRIMAAIHPPDATRRILDCLGLPSRAPPTAPAASEDYPMD